MKYQKIECPKCKKGLMCVQKGRRGMYYRCESCKHTLDQRPVPAVQTPPLPTYNPGGTAVLS